LEFAGAVIVVSHDRHLLRSTADSLYRIADGQLALFEGDLDAYETLILRGSDVQSPGEPEQKTRDGKKPLDRKDQRRAAADARAQRRPLEQAVKKTEQRMDLLQDKLAALETALADPAIYEQDAKARLTELLREQGEQRQALDTLEGEWLSQQEALEAFDESG
jgi:ATP-binding cassette subfamily F protein 3